MQSRAATCSHAQPCTITFLHLPCTAKCNDRFALGKSPHHPCAPMHNDLFALAMRSHTQPRAMTFLQLVKVLITLACPCAVMRAHAQPCAMTFLHLVKASITCHAQPRTPTHNDLFALATRTYAQPHAMIFLHLVKVPITHTHPRAVTHSHTHPYAMTFLHLPCIHMQ